MPHLDGLAHVLSDEFRAKGPADTLRWDKEWMRYFGLGKDYWFYFWDMTSTAYALEVPLEQVAKFTKQEMFSTKLYRGLSGGVWATGEDLVGKDVLEVGCGPGVFGRLSGRFAKSYTGVDVSQFALSIARLTSQKHSTKYVHFYDAENIKKLEKSVDIAVGRNFFIHHNYADALWLLRFMRDCTRDGGLIIADFFSDEKLDDTRRLKASADLQEKYPSALFSFSDDDVAKLCKETGLRCESIEYKPEHQVRYARLRV